ncbi:MAG: hypothetical protein GKR90_17560 [Pseudomonadales bacterium]|nr:hypothetical protein [Pseudomonadales bacterium]
MKLEELIKWLGVITNLGVIAGLTLVAYEISQTNTTMDREYRSWGTNVFQQNQQMWVDWTAIITSNENADIWFQGSIGEKLEPTEKMIFSRLTTTYFFLFYTLYQSGESREQGSAEFAPRDLAAEIRRHPGLISAFRDFCQQYKLGDFCERSFNQLEESNDA